MFFRRAVFLAAALFFSACARDRIHTVCVSVADQRMIVLERGHPIASYPVSTSKFGLGDRRGGCTTPLGQLEVAKKIGKGAPLGMKFKSRKPTGEIVPVNAPGRDPIVTRILWLKGLERQNAQAYKRTIYIHGTPEEVKIGTPASYGCIRMRSRDVMTLFNTIGVGAKVNISRESFSPPVPADAEKLAAAIERK
ncbi:MAG: ErfK/YbiS/YcfS/YnhG family protein [Chthoniobacteraceae bacterium]|nr:ErfK/YbiS/YcfS/YnhG family protein [Chthoniobacteraceae bacterium]